MVEKWFRSIYPPYGMKRTYDEYDPTQYPEGRARLARKYPATKKLRRPGGFIPRAPRSGVVPGYTRTGGFYGRFAGANAELKFHDLDIDDAAVAINGTIAQVSCLTIAQGNTESQRIGRKLVVKQINWRFEIKFFGATAVAASSDVVRVMLYHDKQANGATATVTGILESDDYQSFNQLANKQRFTILMDRTYSLMSKSGSGRGSTDTLAFGEDVISDTFFKTCNIPIEYDNTGTDGAITTMRSSNIGVITLSRDGGSQFVSKMRVRYSDGS